VPCVIHPGQHLNLVTAHLLAEGSAQSENTVPQADRRTTGDKGQSRNTGRVLI
jgi:hypothetical protein